MDFLIAIRLKNRMKKRCHAFGMDDTGPCANHRGDIVAIFKADQALSPKERTEYGIILVTGAPNGKLDRIRELLFESTYIREAVDQPDHEAIVDRPRVISLTRVRLKANSMSPKIDRIFDRRELVRTPPSIPWVTIKQSLWHKVDDKVPEMVV